DPYPQTAENIIGPFMKLIGQDEIWENMKKANAVPRAFAWFTTALNELMGFVNEIPGLFVAAFESLELADIILVPRAFAKLAAVFGDFLGRFTSWAGNTIWKLLEIIFDVVSPGAFSYVKKTGAALKSILQNPLPFVGNLVKAAKLGFQNFAGNFLTHLKKGLIDWLTGALPGVYIPTAITLMEVGKFALSVLGITWAQIRAKIVKALGPKGEMIMAGLEAVFDVVMALKNGGPAAAWAVIKDKLTTLKDQVISGITSFIIETVVTKAIPKLIAMFIPGAGFISAIISIYDTIMVFVQKIKKIIQVVTAFVDSIVAIAGGAIGAAASRVESILGGLLSLAISFLAGFVGLGKVSDKIMGVINKVRASVDKALDAAINFIVTKAKALFGKLFGKDKKDERSEEEKAKALKSAMAEANPLVGDKSLSDAKITQKLTAIKIKYKVKSLQLIVDNKTEQKEVAHIRGENSPPVDGPQAARPADDPQCSIKLERPGFTPKLKRLFRTLYPQAHRPDGTLLDDIDRRHIISSDKMIKHYETVLNALKVSAAAALLTSKGSPVTDPPTNEKVQAAAAKRHRKFFNKLENLWPGASSPNRAIGAADDPPGAGEMRAPMPPADLIAHETAIFVEFGL
ncbi:MAG TPA: hypothetical protein VFB82_24080, partial [Blastocatellia bacterium]|nr:hypothetical protein [Blastocatellia bacterium]